MTGKILIFAGNYGSGKTELALHFAKNAAREGKTLVIDLDMINTYFRLYDHKAALHSLGADIIGPGLVESGIEMLTIPSEIASAFDRDYDTVIIDLGGDSGAGALGQFYPKLLKAKEAGTEVILYDVINVSRPMADSVGKIIHLADAIQQKTRWKIDGFINNSNMSYDTSVEDLINGSEVIGEASRLTGIPVLYTTGRDEIMLEFSEQPIDRADSGELMTFSPQMKRSWDQMFI